MRSTGRLIAPAILPRAAQGQEERRSAYASRSSGGEQHIVAVLRVLAFFFCRNTAEVCLDDRAVCADHGGVFVDDGARFVDDAASFIDDASLVIDDGAIVVDDAAFVIDDAASVVDDGGAVMAFIRRWPSKFAGK
jgi:hypothetical protein